MNKYYPKWLWNYSKLDIIFACIFVFIAIVFIIWSIITEHYGIHLPVLILSSSLIYLFYKEKLSQDSDFPLFNKNNRITLISNIIFTISISIMMWLSWSNLYYRPPLYFLLILVASISIVLYIFHLNELKISHIFIALFKIIVLSLTIYAGIYYQFPGIYGVDPWWHNEMMRLIISSGFLPVAESYIYYLFPLFHIIGSITQEITALTIYDSVFASVGLLMTISSIFVYLIGRKFIGVKAGLLTALIVTLSADNIERGTAIIPMSLGYIFFLITFYLIFKSDIKSFQNALLKIIISISLILTHTIAPLINLISLVTILIINRLSKRLLNKYITYNETVSFGLVLIFFVVMVNRWMQDPPGSSSFLSWNLKNLIKSLQVDTQFVLASDTAMSDIPYEIQLLNMGGFYILFFFTIIGSLIYLHPRNYSSDKIALAGVAGVLFSLPFGLVLFQITNILPDRWYIFMYVPMTVLAVSGILKLCTLLKNRYLIKFYIIIIIVVGIILTMTTNNLANDDSPFVFNAAVRIGYTQSEITAIETLSNMKSGYPVTDIYYLGISRYILGNDEYNSMIKSNNSVFIKRNYYLKHPDWDDRFMISTYAKGVLKYGPEQMKAYDIDKEFLIYNNENVKVYTIYEQINIDYIK